MTGRDSWDSAGLIRLLRALRDELADETPEGVPGPVLAVAARLAGAGRRPSYEEAIERAYTAALGFGDRHLREKQQSDCLLGAFLDQHWERAGWPLVDALLRASFEKRYSDPEVMHRFAANARKVALLIEPDSYPSGVVFDLRARACAELANAERVLERYPEAESFLNEACEWQEQGSGEPALLAHIDELEATLRLEQRRLPEALGLLEQAHALYQEVGETHLAGRTFVSRARVVYTSGDPVEAARLLEQGMTLIDSRRDPALVAACRQALLGYLTDSGEYRRASTLLLESGLGEAFSEEPLNRLRLRWVEARIHAGMERLKRAEGILEEIRLDFLARNLAYDGALAGIDLAGVWLRMGKIGPMPALLLEVSDTFERLKLRTEDALKAVAFLYVTVEMDLLSPAVFERTRRFLARYQIDPDLKFDSLMTLRG